MLKTGSEGASARPGPSLLGTRIILRQRSKAICVRSILPTLAVLLSSAVFSEIGAQKVLFLTHSAGFCHDVVKRKEGEGLSHAERIFTEAARRRFEVTCSQDCSLLSPERISAFDVVVLYTTGDLPVPGKAHGALVEFVEAGGGLVGIHCATDTYPGFTPYRELIGGTFDGHPWHQDVRVRVEDPSHFGVSHFGSAFEIKDEIYQFREFSRDRVRVLLSLDPESVDVSLGKRKDRDYALAWTREHGKGRVFYTALGHRPEVWQDARFLVHVLDGVTWAAKAETLVSSAPASAQSLFADGLSKWRHGDGRPVEWEWRDGIATVVPGKGDILSVEGFGDALLHVEFSVPTSLPEQKGQDRGNSGVYVQGRYEVQILDSFGLESSLGDAGALYGQKVPDRNLALEPETWQAYDIHFRAARFDASGKVVEEARMTVFHNRILIHDDVALRGPTGGGQPVAPGKAPLRLQDHGHRVRFRNLWVKPVD